MPETTAVIPVTMPEKMAAVLVALNGKGGCFMLQDYPDVMTIYQLCEVLHVGRQAIYQLLQNNTIKHVRVGRKYIIPKKSVVDFLQAASVTPTAS